MLPKTIYLMVGCPASGKSSWVRDKIDKFKIIDPVVNTCAHISRDAIRFSLIKENEEYFSRETEVFIQFVEEIQKAIDSGVQHIFIDATHISRGSRKKVLRELALGDYELSVIYIKATLPQLFERNAKRTGLAFVPEAAIANMYNSFEEPTYIEMKQYHPYPSILEVTE